MMPISKSKFLDYSINVSSGGDHLMYRYRIGFLFNLACSIFVILQICLTSRPLSVDDVNLTCLIRAAWQIDKCFKDIIYIDSTVYGNPREHTKDMLKDFQI